MNSTEHTAPQPEGPAPGRKFFVDTTAPTTATTATTAQNGFDVFRRAWESQIGEALPLPPWEPVGSGEFRVRVRAFKVHDTVISGVHGELMAGGTRGASHHLEDRVLVHVMGRGVWRFVSPRDRDETAVPAGQFIVRHNGPPARFEVAPHSSAKVLILPAAPLGPLIRDRATAGPADSPELRLLMAHTEIVEATLDDLTPAGAEAARSALLELVKGVLMRTFDDTEPLLAPALTQAAREIADRLLTDPDLSPATLARELQVSVRTLHRAFAETDDSVAGYIRRRRLEQSRLELTAPGTRLTVSEIAARWQFADSSHFIRAFKKEYGQTPADYARSQK
ncbi:helix-turn-helix domain-containing protein [Streptomyces sp. ATCC 21386]|uniref:helix-turn-helix domain-containing protein n=1 Tax=Streptomyces sp. ATCC 21386 TaxID=2699428 RepID=UPI001BFF6811|nr:helix-turn-helix domain-containing protein [Streptomyces sp. ATCC 21386]